MRFAAISLLLGIAAAAIADEGPAASDYLAGNVPGSPSLPSGMSPDPYGGEYGPTAAYSTHLPAITSGYSYDSSCTVTVTKGTYNATSAKSPVGTGSPVKPSPSYYSNAASSLTGGAMAIGAGAIAALFM